MGPFGSSTERLRVLALASLPTLGGANRLRIEQYVPLLRHWGVELDVSPFFDDATYAVLYLPGHFPEKLRGVLRGLVRRARDLVRIKRYELVVVHRESAPLGAPIFERLLERLGIKYVFDFDDAIYLAPIHPANRRWAWLRHPSRVSETTRRASAVIVGNEYLADWARQWNGDVTVIPTAVDTDRHRPGLAERSGNETVIGWVGSSTTAPYLRILDEPLEQLASMRNDLKVKVVGGIYHHSHIPVENLPYRLEREPEDVASFDIGVLPEPDDPWTRGKGAFKAMLYMAAGIPVVASRVGVNPRVVVHGETGYCANNAAEWALAINRLANAPGLRQEMGLRGRMRVEELFSVRVQAPRLAEVLLRAAGRTVPPTSD